jgi:hypothetical protein
MKRAKGGEIRDEQGRSISALCATVRGNCAHLSGQGSAGDPTRLRAGLVAFGASCASQPTRAELAVQVARQRVIAKYALDTGQRSEMAESLLDALEGSLRIFEKHRIFLLSCSGSSSALRAGRRRDGPELVTTQRVWSVVPESRIEPTAIPLGGQDWLLKKGHKYAHALE